MAMKKVEKKVEKAEYLYGTFIDGLAKITIDAKTDSKKVEAFLKDHPSLKSLVTDKARIESQRKIING